MTQQATTVEPTTVKVPGATLYVEVRGSGPVLLCISGGPTDAGMFTDLATRLADRYTVVSYDQRGHSRSTLDGEPEDIPVALHADDAAAVITAVGKGPAYVYGNSGGGTIGVELLARHPELVHAVVAHEPPIMELLTDAAQWRATFAGITETYRTDGVFAAMGRFGAAVEQGGPKYSEEMQQTEPTPEAQEMMARMAGNFDLFIAHEIRPSVGYVPDIDALRKVSTRIVSAAGETSGEQAARRAAIALAERLGIDVSYLPGAHGGWGSNPQEFADRLHEVLQKGR
ncbi:MAG TPA: alpha/beta fold hydrolase [Pseudonocardiaceae bacterium]|jgi:pimeloyl-ACP methyl ester carboxylesterase